MIEPSVIITYLGAAIEILKILFQYTKELLVLFASFHN